MVITDKHHLPTEEELTVEEVKLSFPTLQAGAFHLGKYCQPQNNEFMLCRAEYPNDCRQCIDYGKEVTSCTLEFFRKLKKTCLNEFTTYVRCIERSSGDYQFHPCRRTQKVLDKCVLANFNIERPNIEYYSAPKIVDTKRPPPPKDPKLKFPDATPGLSEDAPLPESSYPYREVFA
ncbi:NADH dehydrogenase [ubiquinone] 1 alpha subcomplex subunit 8 [Leptopilina heterotoma]|uniref:NADH dehydrogenase [ubiquinone] 1 alpha subcomplex subunit 8 n=1 Tax=Leptopilina heterotoma TaxID=63436 RepID=UPI001CA866C3|nr:NADH dehydrogenase [ubiquinone] 1 alpha subcomplex subunit 8 [Leptopilina heterotoma]